MNMNHRAVMIISEASPHFWTLTVVYWEFCLPFMCICGARFCKPPFKVPRNRYPAWRTGTTTLFVIPARQVTLHRLAESIPWNRFLGSLKVYGLCFRRGFVIECYYVIKTPLLRGVIDTTELRRTKKIMAKARQFDRTVRSSTVFAKFRRFWQKFH